MNFIVMSKSTGGEITTAAFISLLVPLIPRYFIRKFPPIEVPNPTIGAYGYLDLI